MGPPQMARSPSSKVITSFISLPRKTCAHPTRSASHVRDRALRVLGEGGRGAPDDAQAAWLVSDGVCVAGGCRVAAGGGEQPI